jgi:hypothetical protein
MTLSRGQLIPVVLVALAILLPGAGEAQGNCCSCSFSGTNCSACCYVDQTASCVVDIAGSVLFCSCTCEAIGGGGGGGGGGAGCALTLSSHTIVMGADRGAKLAGHQLGFGLLHPGTRREGSFNFEEWALVSSAGAVLRASTVEFADRVQNEAERFRPRGKGASPSIVLVIEDADHPHNSREIPVPALAPIDFDAGLPVSLAGQEMWFRAEVGEDGVIDQMILLNIPEDLVSGKDLVEGSLNGRLRERLSLRFADERRHRAVVFGLVRANTEGHLVMTRSHVILPKGCCYGRHCV